MPAYLQHREDTVQLIGSVTIDGDAKYGEMLTANTSSLTSAPEGELGTLGYQWKHSDSQSVLGTQATYTLTEEDIGKPLMLSVTADNCQGEVTSLPTAPVSKADGPPAPGVMGSYTGDGTSFTYTMNAVSGGEYAKGDGPWQENHQFEGFHPGEVVTFRVRLQETATHLAGDAGSIAVTFVKLDDRAAPALFYTVSDDRDSITITAMEGAQYKFDDDGWSSDNRKSGYIGTEAVTIQIRLEETGTHNPSPATMAQVSLTKEDQQSPGDFTLTYTYHAAGNYFTVSMPTTDGAEYSFDGSHYGDERTRTAWPGDVVTGYMRYKETNNHHPSPVTTASVTLPYYATAITVTGAGGRNSITSAGGTMQMLAEVSPVQAGQGVTWSVIGSESAATISKDGMLTAKANGSVTVRATATDGSGIHGELAVTISGQSSSGGSGGSSGGSTSSGGGGSTSASLSQTTVAYPTQEGGSVSVTLTRGSYTLRKITCGGVTLTEGKDYTISGGTCTLTEDFLSALKVGTYEIMLEMSGGTNPVLHLAVTDTIEATELPLKPSVTQFTDVKESGWFYAAVNYVYEKEIMQGTGSV